MSKPPPDTPQTRSGYEILAEVSRGGQGVVYRARHRDTQRIVALKVYPDARQAGAAGADDRLERELAAAQRLDHPGIVQVFGAEQLPDGAAIAMQWIDGQPIDAWAASCGPGREAVRRKLRLFVAVCDAVRHAHQRGVLHRDLKPGNILVDSEDRPFVVDFGIARVFSTDSTAAGDTIGLAGTPSFLAPEILFEQTREPDVRTDVYALGGVLFVLLTGQTPFPHARDLAAMIHAVETAEPGRVSTSSQGVGRELDHVVRKALALEPNNRYQSVDALADDLQRYLRAEPVRAHPPSTWYRLRKTARRYPAASGFAIAAAALAVTFAATSMVHALDLEKATKTVETAARRAELDAADLQQTVGEFRFLLNSVRLTRARDEATGFFPADPARAIDIERWVADLGAPLAAALPHAIAARDTLRSRALPWSRADRERDRHGHPGFDELEVVERHAANIADDVADATEDDDPPASKLREQLARYENRAAQLGADVAQRRTYRFESRRDAYRHDALTRLIAELEVFGAADGLLARVRDQLEWTRRVDALSLHGPADSWQMAIEAIAKSPEYGGLRITPQRGLVPLGRDPHSGLWEFVHLRSSALGGTEPETEAAKTTVPERRDGKLVVNEDTGIVLVLLPGGAFSMGSQTTDATAPNYDPHQGQYEGPVHRISLDPFFIGKFETTQAQWRRLSFGGTPSRISPDYDMSWAMHGPLETYGWSHPVESVSWYDCVEILDRHGLLLPTEAQWEYAYRAGTTTPWSTGTDPSSLNGHVNCADAQYGGLFGSRAHDAAINDGRVHHAAVGTYAANPFGLHDTHGNVGEWCRDAFDLYRRVARTGDGLRRAPTSDSQARVVRGGDHTQPPNAMRAAHRSGAQPGATRPGTGVRVTRRLEQ